METTGPLHKWFAWRPIKLHKTGKFIWLRCIYYRFNVVDYFGCPDHMSWTEYYTEEEALLLLLTDEASIQETYK